MSTIEIIVRLALAALCGVALGLNRDLHGKPTGVRTLGLVGLASAIVVMAIGTKDVAAPSRVIQGIVTGIGFLGAGVIIRGATGKRVHNLTTAACVWLTACVGAACAVGEWRLLAAGAPIVALILLLGGRFEKWMRQLWPDDVDVNGQPPLPPAATSG
jgi:putative Mg2+ transporter-C (MgtC) family protein